MAEKCPEKPLCQLSSFLHDTEGATAVEYGVLLMMVGLALLGVISLTDVSNHISNTFNFVSAKM